jgi:hypothetical protein
MQQFLQGFFFTSSYTRLAFSFFRFYSGRRNGPDSKFFKHSISDGQQPVRWSLVLIETKLNKQKKKVKTATMRGNCFTQKVINHHTLIAGGSWRSTSAKKMKSNWCQKLFYFQIAIHHIDAPDGSGATIAATIITHILHIKFNGLCDSAVALYDAYMLHTIFFSSCQDSLISYLFLTLKTVENCELNRYFRHTMIVFFFLV